MLMFVLREGFGLLKRAAELQVNVPGASFLSYLTSKSTRVLSPLWGLCAVAARFDPLLRYVIDSLTSASETNQKILQTDRSLVESIFSFLSSHAEDQLASIFVDG